MLRVWQTGRRAFIRERTLPPLPRIADESAPTGSSGEGGRKQAGMRAGERGKGHGHMKP